MTKHRIVGVIVISAREVAYKERDRDAASDTDLADTINELQDVIDKLERKLARLDAGRRPRRGGDVGDPAGIGSPADRRGRA